jgi:hypothetical protein
VCQKVIKEGLRVLSLKGLEPVGKGTNRACYQHPEDETKCIKVTISDDFAESNREKKYYSLLERREISWEMLARYYGTVETDMGEGLVFDLIRDADGLISKPLVHYFTTEALTSELEDPIGKFHALKQYLLEQKIIVKDLGIYNILYQKLNNGGGRYMIIDGVTNNDFLPFATYIDYFAVKKITRRWERFATKFRNRIQNNPLALRLYNQNPF